MKQETGFSKVAGTCTTSSALSRVQLPRSGVFASEQTKIKAVSILWLPSSVDGRVLLCHTHFRLGYFLGALSLRALPSKARAEFKQELGHFPRIDSPGYRRFSLQSGTVG